jgi:hypothetical protein
MRYFLFNKESELELNRDGSLTLAFAPRKPQGLPEPNWLPTPEGQPYNLTYRFYGPSQDLVSGAWFPPALIEQELLALSGHANRADECLL